jgi:hypothetical protein
MPRLTVINAEKIYKNNQPRYQADPGAFRSPEDFCQTCFGRIDVDALAKREKISVDFAEEQVNGLADEQGLLNDDHPDYGDLGYECVQCGKTLTDDDN